jgi:hypothetical protein
MRTEKLCYHSQLFTLQWVSSVGLVYSFIGHRIGYSHSQEVSICIHKNSP